MGALRPLNEIMQPQQYQQPVQQQPVQQAPQQPAQQMPVQQVPQQQQAAGNTYTMPLQTEAQLAQMQNNGRVEIVVQDASQGYQVISSDQLNIAAIERQNAQLGQELRLFDTNNDGWLVEAELKSTAVGQAPAAQNSLAEDLAIGAIGGAISGGVVSKIPLLKKIPAAIGSKLGISGTLAGIATGAVIGLAGSWISRSGNSSAPQQAAGPAGYRPETQWQNQRLVKTVL